LEAVKELSEKLVVFIQEEATIQVKIERFLRIIEKCDPYQKDIDEVRWKAGAAQWCKNIASTLVSTSIGPKDPSEGVTS